MNFFIIYPLIIVSLFIKLEKLGIRANENTVDLISSGEDVVRGVTSFLNSLSLKNAKGPFSTVLVNENYLKSSESNKKLSSNLFIETPKEAQHYFWNEIMEIDKVPSLGTKTLLIPGQLGVLLLMVFNQIMCEASILIKDLDKFSNEKREKYLKFLSRLYNENIQMIPEDSKHFFNVPIPTLCLDKKLYGMSNEDQSDLGNILKRSKNYRETSFILYNCFDTRTQRIIQEFLAKVHSWDTKCSRLIKKTNKFSFEFLDKFHEGMDEMMLLMRNLEVSGLTFRSALGKYLRKEKTQNSYNINAGINDLGVQDLSLEESEVTQKSKLNLKKSSNPHGKRENTMFRKIASFMKKKPKRLVNENYIKSITETKALKDISGDNSIYDQVIFREPYDTSTQPWRTSSHGTTINSKSLEPIFGSLGPRRSRSKATATNKEFQFMGEKETEDEPLLHERVKKIANIRTHYTDTLFI
ncbi:uncharacterized protein LOC128882516 isoform X2 [Hylaeus volcanicus]|uniref:uncharacterized protein LOC128882516 isoform X2 n=1 Tax=Hylaeus volcanicus TaxID=313075 RepID=UPI0023B80A56|nr:uncharacterized protein LOC128882516 isoform X2 [Hylaeus volcanicus]